MIDENKLIERLQEYIISSTSGDFAHGLVTAVYVTMNQPKIGGWIPCSERLPEENQSVIACFAHGTVTELRFYDKKFHGIYDYDEKVIAAWQPLPEAYHG